LIIKGFRGFLKGLSREGKQHILKGIWRGRIWDINWDFKMGLKKGGISGLTMGLRTG
jgi:hypothetical protein